MEIQITITLDNGDIINATEDSIESNVGMELVKTNTLVEILHRIKETFKEIE